MRLISEKFSHRNLDDVFRLILLIYGRIMKETYMSKFMLDNLRNSMIINLKQNRLLQQPLKTELINWHWLGILQVLPPKTVMTISSYSYFNFISSSFCLCSYLGRSFIHILFMSTINEKLVEWYIFYLFLWFE